MIGPLDKRYLHNQFLISDYSLKSLADNLLFIGLSSGPALISDRPSFVPALSIKHWLKSDDILKQRKLNLIKLGGGALEFLFLDIELSLEIIDFVDFHLLLLFFCSELS